MYKNFTSSDELIFSLYRLMEGRQHKTNLLRKIELKDVWRDYLNEDDEW